MILWAALMFGIYFYASQRFDGTLIIALNWLGSYYFIVHKVG